MSLLTECPTDIQNLLAEFVGHPYVVGSEPRSFFFDTAGASGHKYEWGLTWAYETKLHYYAWPYRALFYKVTGVDGSSIKIQGYKCLVTYPKGPLLEYERSWYPKGPVLERTVHETIEKDGACSYWVVLREPTNSSTYGACLDDEGRFCPMELLVFDVDERCPFKRMIDIYFLFQE